MHLLFESIIGISTTSSRGVYSRAAFNRKNTVIKELIGAVIALTKHYLSYITDLNECSRDKYYCHRFATCTNNRGSFTCTCDLQQGFIGDGYECNLNYASK